MIGAGTVEVTARVRVRVTLEADAAKIPGTQLLRISTGEGIAVINPEASNVTVEEVIPDRSWTDGDVVQSVFSGKSYARETARRDGRSVWVGPHGLTYDDEDITPRVTQGKFRVLRYQAGEK